jgi:hypothetical protein
VCHVFWKPSHGCSQTGTLIPCPFCFCPPALLPSLLCSSALMVPMMMMMLSPLSAVLPSRCPLPDCHITSSLARSSTSNDRPYFASHQRSKGAKGSLLGAPRATKLFCVVRPETLVSL